MKSKLTLSLLKVYVGVAGLLLVAIYQVSQSQPESAFTSFSAALSLLGIGHQTAATRATVDPSVAKPATVSA